MRKFLTAFALSVVCCFSAYAQKVNLPPNLNIETEYDRFKDITTIRLKGDEAANVKGNVRKVLFAAFAMHKGKALTETASPITILIAMRSEEWQFSGIDRSPALRVIIDGNERVLLGEMTKVIGEVEKRGGVYEQLAITISLKDLNKLANAKKIEMQVGNVEFELTESLVFDVRDFARAVVP